MSACKVGANNLSFSRYLFLDVYIFSIAHYEMLSAIEREARGDLSPLSNKTTTHGSAWIKADEILFPSSRRSIAWVKEAFSQAAKRCGEFSSSVGFNYISCIRNVNAILNAPESTAQLTVAVSEKIQERITASKLEEINDQRFSLLHNQLIRFSDCNDSDIEKINSAFSELAKNKQLCNLILKAYYHRGYNETNDKIVASSVINGNKLGFDSFLFSQYYYYRLAFNEMTSIIDGQVVSSQAQKSTLGDKLAISEAVLFPNNSQSYLQASWALFKELSLCEAKYTEHVLISDLLKIYSDIGERNEHIRATLILPLAFLKAAIDYATIKFATGVERFVPLIKEFLKNPAAHHATVMAELVAISSERLQIKDKKRHPNTTRIYEILGREEKSDLKGVSILDFSVELIAQTPKPYYPMGCALRGHCKSQAHLMDSMSVAEIEVLTNESVGVDMPSKKGDAVRLLAKIPGLGEHSKQKLIKQFGAVYDEAHPAKTINQPNSFFAKLTGEPPKALQGLYSKN
jgi:hypothetical protein